MKNNALILIQKYTDEDCLFCQKYGRLAADKISFAPLLNRVTSNYTKGSLHQVFIIEMAGQKI